MKRFLTLAMTVFLTVFGLSGCGCDDGRNVGLVFVNGSDAAIVSVSVDFVGRGGGTQHADNSPMERGEYFGFEVWEYPATVAAYDGAVATGKELARIVIDKAPPEGERWYVTARDGAGGLMLTADTRWPEGV